MATSIKQLILDDILVQLATITPANSYNTTIRYTNDVILPSDKLNADRRRAAAMARFIGQDNERTQGLVHNAQANYKIRAVMENATHTAFMNFLDDVEACLMKDETRGSLDGDYYKVLTTSVISIQAAETEEFNDDRIREANIIVRVWYDYVPGQLSGT